MGLLTDNLGFDDPQTTGLLSLGLRLMSTPGKFGTALGQAGLGALGDIRQAQQLMDIRTQRAEQMKQEQLRQQMLEMQLAQARQAQADQEAMRALAQQSARNPGQMAVAQNGGPTLAAAAAMPTTASGFDWNGYSQGLAAIDPSKSLAIQQMLKKEQSKFSTEPRFDQNGRAYIVAEDGRVKFLDGVSARDELVRDDNGGSSVLRTKYSPNPVAVVAKTVNPDTIATNNVTMRGQNMTARTAADRLNFDKEAGGGFEYRDDGMGGTYAVPKKPTGPGPIQAVPVNMPNKNARNSSDALAIVSEARALIPQATGSYVGLGLDKAAQTVGMATDGAEATAKLKVLQAGLMMKQPRMEGPQGVQDVVLYREAAGQIADPTLPRSVRLAALDTIQQMHERYGSPPATPPWLNKPQGAPTGPRFLGFEQ